MEEKPVSIDPTVNKVEEAENRTPDGLARGRSAKPSSREETCKGPPRDNRVVASHDALDGDSQVTNVAAETLYVGYQTGPTRWATESLVGLVHHIRVGQFLYQLQPTPGYNLLKIRSHQRFWLHLDCSRTHRSSRDRGSTSARYVGLGIRRFKQALQTSMTRAAGWRRRQLQHAGESDLLRGS
jgi:hypothetical protein